MPNSLINGTLALALIGMFATSEAVAQVSYTVEPPSGPYVAVPGSASQTSGFTGIPVTGSVFGSADPTGGTQNYWLIGLGPGFGGSASLIYQSLQATFGMLWGSPDSTNVVSFFNNGSLIGSVSGTQMNTELSVPLGDPSLVYQVYFTVAGGFDKVTFTSGGVQFEAGNFTATPVPGPIAGAGLPVMAFAGYIAWRRRRAVAA